MYLSWIIFKLRLSKAYSVKVLVYRSMSWQMLNIQHHIFLKPSPRFLVTQVSIPCVHDMDGCVAGAGVVYVQCSTILARFVCVLLVWSIKVHVWHFHQRSPAKEGSVVQWPQCSWRLPGSDTFEWFPVFTVRECKCVSMYRVSCEVFSGTFLGLSCYFHCCPWFLVHSLKQFTALSTSWLWCYVNLVLSSSL